MYQKSEECTNEMGITTKSELQKNEANTPNRKQIVCIRLQCYKPSKYSHTYSTNLFDFTK